MTPEHDHQPILNQIQLDSIRSLNSSNGDALVKRILQIFVETSADQVRQIEQALKNKDNENLYHAAHTLKSSSANIGAESLSIIAKKLELHGRSHELAHAVQLQNDLSQQYQLVVTEIEKMLDRL
ncbi:HPt (histidine-containing phosphotransfer) domain-containing protein [Nitrosomonas sp. Nm51]|uniref:Hpt domain-containing protein n=1 Tax=Nitrosomonas sp. Nm51 TaxID=133720 RepID=UPI0008CB2A1F|nr:Hpt domain-containing protein [Nitrosomonas sp. Nm51]SER61442.1 HPt (histidine-containing phosphotransfer) domain-containing protein [Nitrosomonas sp. Nm51]